jgi:hypothetical protein
MLSSDETAPDPFIEEIRERRRRISARFCNDVNRYFDELVRREREHPERIAVPVRRRLRSRSSEVEPTGPRQESLPRQ